MDEENEKFVYAPQVTAYASVNGKKTTVILDVPAGQEWLHTMLEHQAEDVKAIKGWVIFFGIVVICVLLFLR